mmetsp:Transcript_15020/g.42583  ORF Transcript_15020/g.42583 Transcript_15020/m.42583 type:complete len:265 (+) Transcript_15020:491-1285(+)
MATERQVETAEAIARDGVRSALEHDCLWGEALEDLGDHRAEDGDELVVRDAVLQRKVDGVALALAHAVVLPVASVGEKVAVLVEAAGHDAVGGVERLFDAVAVVDIYVNVQHALVVFEELENGQHAVVDVAKPAGLRLLGVVQAAGPVDDDVRGAGVEALRAAYTAARVNLYIVEQIVEHRAVLAHVEALQLADKLVHVVWGDHAEEVDIVVAVEAGDFGLLDERRAEDLKVVGEPVAHDQVVRHAHAMGLHWVALAIVEVADL